MYPVHPRHQTSRLHSPVLTARHFLIGSLSYLVILLGGIVTGSEPRSSMTPPYTQRRSPVASTDLFGASRGRLRTKETRQTPRITPEQAAAFAVNDLHPTTEGYMLRHPRHLASFTRDGVHFTARRGGLEWHWQLTHIGTNEAPLREVELRAIPPVQDTIGTVSYIRGAGIVEHYRTQARGLEQQFVITQPLALAGADLVIRGQVQSAGTFAATPHGWEWRTEQGAVNLGTVKVVDAIGQTVPATMEVTAEETRITVAGTALAQATYPVTIDPEIGANDFRISDMGPDGDPKFNVFDPAIAYNSTDNEYLVVWSGTDNTGLLVDSESEIFGQRINAETGAEVGENDFRISDMGPDGDPNFDARTPAVAYNSTNNEYLVVWSGDDNTAPLVDEEFEIFGQRLNATGGEVGTNDFRISHMGPDGDINFGAFNPAVVYNSTNNEYLIVWEGDDNTPPLVDNEVEIFGQRLAGATGVAAGTRFRISDMGTDGSTAFAARTPAVAYNSTNNEYLVVWSGDDNTAPLVDDEFEIFGQRLNAATGAEVAPNDFRISDMGTDGSTAFAARTPAVAYNSTNNEYLVVWSGDDNTPPLVNGEFEIFGQRLNAATGAEVAPNDFRVSHMGPDGNSNFDAFNPAVAYNSTNNEYLVVWDGDDNTFPLVDQEAEIFGQRLDAMTGTSIGSRIRFSDMGPDGDPNFVARMPAVAYNTTNNEFLVVWRGDDNIPPLVDNEFEVYGQRFTTVTIPLVAAVLPSSRSVQVGTPATALATIINAAPAQANNVGIALPTLLPVSFIYQTTDATGVIIGAPNTPVNIAPGGVQNFVLVLTPSGAFTSTDMVFNFIGSNTLPVTTILGVNTLLFSASDTAVPDVIALAATLNGDGIVNIPGASGTGVFAVATVNVGIGGPITATANTGGVSLPVTLSMCQTDPLTGCCLAGCIVPTTTSIPTTIDANATPSFGIFVQGTGAVPFDPAVNRIFVSFADTGGGAVRGSTSVAVRTTP